MLKFIFWSLLLANGALLALQLSGGAALSDKREPNRLANQLNADKIKLVSPQQANAVVQVPAPTPPAPTSATTALAQPAPAVPPVAKKKEQLVACTEIGNFPPPEAKRFEDRLAALALGDRQSRHNVQEVASHMVYIPPQGDKEGADRRVTELRQLGISNFFVIQDNSTLRWGISLGIFKTETAAKNHLANLTQQGVRGARIGARSVTSNKLAYQLRNLDPATKARLDQIKADFPNQEMHSCG
jgi:hypothetical protein